MKTRIVVPAVFAALVVGLGGPASRAGDKKDPPMAAVEAKDQVTKYLDQIGALKQQPKVAWVDEPALKDVFPDVTFIAVQFRQYPIAFAPPKGLSSSNVFAVSKGGKMEILMSPTALEKFFHGQFKATMGKVTEKSAAPWGKAWLSLWQELIQDGFYGFDIGQMSVETNDKMIAVKGRSMVTKGGKGELNVTLDFGPDQALKITPVSKLMPGPRPICQATKLLDPDPIVRHMAETELLFMGVAAKDYLREQRARATDPQLVQAIDRILQRIEMIGW
jgi:hypothetical protein